MIPFSVLDLVPVRVGDTPADALRNTLDLAQHAERWGYLRYWMAEHHNMTGIASAATSVCIAHVAAATKTIRVGAGGVMLPNHAPLVIAEQFGTLDALFPGRIDLGIGRAPGTDQRTMRALRRSMDNADNFPRDVQEVLAFLAPAEPNQLVQAVPGGGANVPVWILGSSTFGAQLAGILGLPYAFASHFAPDYLFHALKAYRERFQPSEYRDRPYAMAGVQAIVAETDAEARRLFTSMQQAFTNMQRNTRGRLQPPIDDIDTYWTPAERQHATRMLACSFVGSAETVERQLRQFIADTGADELIVATAVYDRDARFRSYELLKSLDLG